MTVPYTFANATGTLALAELDANFANVKASADTAIVVTANAQPAITSLGTLSSLAVAGNVSAAGNIVTSGFFVGNFAGNITGNLIVPGANTQVLYNNNGNATASPGLTFNGASNVLSTSGNVTASGNVRGNYILGNGSLLTGLPAAYGNSNVVTLLAGFGNNAITTNGYITAGLFVGNVIGSAANAVYANTAAIATFALTANTSSTVTANIQPNITSVGTLLGLSITGNTNGANVLASGIVSAVGNIFANNFVTGAKVSRYMDVSVPAYANITATGTYSLSTTSSINILIANNTGYTATINMPTSPSDGQICNFAVHGNVVTLAVGTGTVLPTFAGSTAVGVGYRYVYRVSNTSWYRIG